MEKSAISRIFTAVIMGKDYVTYKCNCSKEKIENGIISLGKEEISKIIEEDGKLEAECHFCHKKYNFSLEELKEIERGAK